MIQRVYEQVKKAGLISHVVVATDDDRILNHVKDFDGDVCMTKDTHPTGTDRCYEAYTLLKQEFDYIINIQGDEPFIQPDQIDQLASCLDGKTEIATLIKKIELADELLNVGEVKVVKDINNRALYFSRAAIPFLRNIPADKWFDHHTFHKHIGLYAFRKDIMKSVCALPVSALEEAESLEQLRWMENGFNITCAETNTESLCIETPEDLDRAVAYLKQLL
jgi:3-deoxy-manno-octulosonate cytidylyltransferase (CMP-KDO synthetase)